MNKKISPSNFVFIALFLLISTFGSPVFAQDTSEADSDVEHFKIAKAFVEDHKSVIYENILATFDLDLQSGVELQALIPKVYELISEKIVWEEVSTQMAFTLVGKFSKEELIELSEFMKTETEQKFMQISPELLRFYQQTGIILAMQHSGELETLIRLYLE